jgi:hypothetical protein
VLRDTNEQLGQQLEKNRENFEAKEILIEPSKPRRAKSARPRKGIAEYKQRQAEGEFDSAEAERLQLKRTNEELGIQLKVASQKVEASLG